MPIRIKLDHKEEQRKVPHTFLFAVELVGPSKQNLKHLIKLKMMNLEEGKKVFL